MLKLKIQHDQVIRIGEALIKIVPSCKRGDGRFDHYVYIDCPKQIPITRERTTVKRVGETFQEQLAAVRQRIATKEPLQ